MIKPKAVLIFESVKGESVDLAQAVGCILFGIINIQGRQADLPAGFRSKAQGRVNQQLGFGNSIAIVEEVVNISSYQVFFRRFLSRNCTEKEA